VRIEVDGANRSAAISFDEPFQIVLTNDSDRPLRIWNPNTENGYYQWTLQLTNTRTGVSTEVRRRRVEDQGFWKAMAQGIEPGTEILEIAPRAEYLRQILLGDFQWGERGWEDLPAPNAPDTFSIVAQFQSTNENDDAQVLVWAGTILSPAVNARLSAPRLKTPHDYLRNGYSDRAIEMMAADPKLIALENEDHYTPLHFAAWYDRTDAVKWLVDNDADVNAVGGSGFTPMHLAGRPEIAELILQKKPDLNVRDRSSGRTPLQAAASRLTEARGEEERVRWRQLVDLYLRFGAEYDILTAIYLDDLERIETILAQSPELADGLEGVSPLRTAADLGRLEICQYLIREHRADVDDFDSGSGYPIIVGTLAHPQLARLLIESGADLTTRISYTGFRTGIWIIGDEATALHYAAANGVPETIRLLVDAGIDIHATAHDSFDETETQTALEVAALFGKADNALAIVSHPKFDEADPQTRQTELNKCLVQAAHHWLGAETDRPKLMRILLDEGADPNARENGHTAVQVAAAQMHPTQIEENQSIRDTVAALLDAGCDLEIRNKSEETGTLEETALHCAAFWGHYEIAKQLIDAGADVNALDARKATPLDEAARVGNSKLQELLLESGSR